MRYRIFYYLAAFSKKAVFSEKMAKRAKSPLKEGVSINFLWEMKFSILFHLTIFFFFFSKKATFSEKMAEKIFRGYDHFLGGGVILR